MPQDSTPHFDKPSESVPPSFHLSQFEEFESKNHFEKEQENESVHEDEIFLQPMSETVINPIFEKRKIHESPNDQFFDIFDDDDECIYVDNLFEENVEMHTTCLENAENNCDDACMNSKALLNEIICEDDLNIFCEKKFVEEHEFSLEHVEKIARTPFGRKPIDLSVFTFDEPTNNHSFEDNVSNQDFEKIFEDKQLFCDEWGEVICENLFGEDDEEFVRRRKKIRRRLRRRKTKMERGLAKMTKRLSSTKSSLKRTHWNDGKRARGFRPREI
jgi:hypothetical protein